MENNLRKQVVDLIKKINKKKRKLELDMAEVAPYELLKTMLIKNEKELSELDNSIKAFEFILPRIK